MQKIEAIYEDGVFKPLKKVNLKNGQKVIIHVFPSITEKTFGVIKLDRKEVDKIIEEIEDGWGEGIL